MHIPPNLIESVRGGKVILFLGAGASFGATSAKGSKPQSSEELSKLLSEKFLGGADADQPLSIVAEYAINETDLITVQTYIRDLFIEFEPSEFHKLIPTFKWAGLATTNYDLIVERAYDATLSPIQEIVPFISNRDRVDSKLRNENTVPYIKLHGCISRWEDPNLPLILTIDQYITHRKNRNVLFQRLTDYGSEYPIVFVGHSLHDPDLRQILIELSDVNLSRPRFFIVTPNPTDLQVRSWESKKITTLSGSLRIFLKELNKQIKPAIRAVRLPEREHPIEEKFVSNESQLSANALGMLASSVLYLHPNLSTEYTKQSEFYSGYSYGWDAIQRKYDARRELEDTILSETIYLDDIDRPSFCDFYLIKGHAGSGKTIIMKRIAWDAMIDFDRLCLYCDTSNGIDSESIFEILEKTKERLFLFIDNASDHFPDIKYLVETARRQRLSLTIFTTSRTNEWNIESGSLNSLLDDVYEVLYLKPSEISILVEKLESQNSLGLLKDLSRDEQIAAFANKAGRQLLVALHEVTMGKPFEEIVFDEYKQILPNAAKLLYLTICTLNRLNIPVRAGTIKRIHKISFSEFKRNFFGPLESVVFSRKHSVHDIAYFARHPWIAEIVFERGLTDVGKRYDLYIRLLKALDVGYDSDRAAFRSLIKARDLIKLFPDPNMIREIYRAVEQVIGDDPYYYQQRAIFEMRRDNPNFNKAYELLKTANRLAPYDRSISHSLAELELQRAEQSGSQVEKNRHLNAASEIASTLTGANAENSHGFHTRCKIALNRVGYQIEQSPDDDQITAEMVKNAEEIIQIALQRFPDDEYLLDAEAKLAEIIGANQKAMIALERAFDLNPISPYISRGLARLHERSGNFSKAREVLEKCLNVLQSNKKTVHAGLARLLTYYFPEEGGKAEYHWRRSFTDGDANYQNRFWYSRQLWINGKKDDARKIFFELRSARVDPDIKAKVRGIIVDSDGNPNEYRGRIKRLEYSYAFVSGEFSNEWIFLHSTNVDKITWSKLKLFSHIFFQLGFTYRGPAACQISIVND